jgi:protein tyrosine phosphatase (PTP) superfamily phosphohydrolase (DUF442 family)
MMKDATSEIRDFLYIEPDIFTAGQPTQDQIRWLGEQKFEVVINLATEKSPDAIRNEQELVMENGMAYVHIPVDWEDPKKADIQKFFHFFGSVHLFKTFTHCALNMRVSSFVFLYRTLAEKANPDACLLDLLTIWKPNPTWQNFIDAMLCDPDLCNPPVDWKVDWDHLSIVPPEG